jgi:hypothetical protein
MRSKSQFARSVRRYSVLLLALACKDHTTGPKQTDALASGATTTITATPASLTAGGTSIIVVQAKDSAGANIAVGGDAVVLSTDAGTLSTVVDGGHGIYGATITGTVARDVHITGTINGTAIAHGVTVTFVAGAAAAIAKTAGDAQTGTVGAALGVAPSVTITDANGNPVAGVAVTFAVASGGGTVTGGTQTTNASGIATLSSWTLGLTAGVNTLTATANALTTTFSATGTAGAVAHFAVTAVGGGTISAQTAGTSFNVQVIALDANNNTATAFTGTAVVTSTGTLTGAPITSAAFVNGVLASQAVTITNTGSFTLTATNGTTSGASAGFTVVGGAATHFAVTAVGGGAIPAETAGTPFNIQITALDANGNIATAFASTAVLTSAGTLSGAPLTTPAFTSGVLAAQAVTITNTGSFTLTATNGVTVGSSAAFSIGGGATTHFSVTAVGGGALPQQTSATPFNIQITALDANNNTAPFSGTAILTSTGALTGAPLTTAAFTNGVLASQPMTITNSGSFTLTATNGTTTGSSAGFTVTAGAVTHFAVTAVGGGVIPQQTAGTPFNIQIAALDANGNTATSFASTAVLTSTGTLTGAPLTTPAFTSGVLAAQAVTITHAGSFTLTATNGTTSGASPGFTVVGGAATHFAVTAVGGGVIPAETAGTPFNVQITALDGGGNTATSFASTAVLTSTGTLTGAPLTTAAFTNGVLASQAVTITTSGSFSLPQTPATHGSTGSSSAFTVNAGALTHFAVTAVGGGAIPAQAAGTSFNVQLTALDGNGNTATSFASTAILTSTGALTGAPVTTAAFTSGVLASQSVTITNIGSFTLTATRTAGTETGTSAAVVVNAGPAATIQRSGSLVLNTVVGTPLANYPAVLLRDVAGNPVPNSSGVSISFSVISGSCSTSAVLTTTAVDGTASLSSSNLTLPSAAGSCLVRATSPTLSGSPIDFDVVIGPSSSVYTWLGATSTDITVSSNWSGPTSTPNGSSAAIFIPKTVPNFPNLTAAISTTLGAATLEAGAGLTVSANVLTLAGNVAAGTGSTVTILPGATVLFQGPTTTLGNLTVNSGTASFSHNATVSGALSALNSAVVTHSGSGLTLTVAGALTSSSGTTLSGLTTVAFTGSTFPVYGNATTAGTPVVTQISHNMTVPGGISTFVNNLTVSDAALSVNGDGTVLTVGAGLDVKSSTGAAGEILMNSGDPTLIVTGTATFRGKAQNGQGLTAGTLDLRGDFVQQDRTTGSHGEFEPGPLPFVVKFTGGGSGQSVSFAHPGTSPGTESYFTNVLVVNQGGVTQSTSAYVNGGTMTVGGPPADALSPAFWATGFGNSTLFITGGGALAVRQSGTFTVTSGGTLDLTGGSCTQYQAGLVSGNVVGGTCTVDAGLGGSAVLGSWGFVLRSRSLASR